MPLKPSSQKNPYRSLLFCLLIFTGCAAFHPSQSDAESATSTQDNILSPLTAAGPKSPAKLQLEVMDFSDLFVNGVWEEVDGAFSNDTDPARRVAALSWKIRNSSAAMEIAAGADPRTNLLDMAIFITTGEWALNHYWIPEIFKENAEGLRRHYRDMKTQIWTLVDETLTAEQSKLLRSLIAKWLETNPRQFELSSIRFRNLEGVEPADFRKEKSARGLLASVRRWLGEVNTSLLFGERMLFYLERTPRILTQQTDLTLAQIANDFPITTFQPDINALTTYLETLPEKLQTSLNANPDLLPALSGTLTDTRQLITSSTDLVTSATQLSSNLNTTMDRLGIFSATNQTSVMEISANLAKAADALDSLNTSISGINELLTPDAHGSSKVSSLIQQLDTQTTQTLDLIYNRALRLIIILFLAAATLLILSRLLFKKPQ